MATAAASGTPQAALLGVTTLGRFTRSVIAVDQGSVRSSKGGTSSSNKTQISQEGFTPAWTIETIPEPPSECLKGAEPCVPPRIPSAFRARVEDRLKATPIVIPRLFIGVQVKAAATSEAVAINHHVGVTYLLTILTEARYKVEPSLNDIKVVDLGNIEVKPGDAQLAKLAYYDAPSGISPEEAKRRGAFAVFHYRTASFWLAPGANTAQRQAVEVCLKACERLKQAKLRQLRPDLADLPINFPLLMQQAVRQQLAASAVSVSVSAASPVMQRAVPDLLARMAMNMTDPLTDMSLQKRPEPRMVPDQDLDRQPREAVVVPSATFRARRIAKQTVTDDNNHEEADVIYIHPPYKGNLDEYGRIQRVIATTVRRAVKMRLQNPAEDPVRLRVEVRTAVARFAAMLRTFFNLGNLGLSKDPAAKAGPLDAACRFVATPEENRPHEELGTILHHTAKLPDVSLPVRTVPLHASGREIPRVSQQTLAALGLPDPEVPSFEPPISLRLYPPTHIRKDPGATDGDDLIARLNAPEVRVPQGYSRFDVHEAGETVPKDHHALVTVLKNSTDHQVRVIGEIAHWACRAFMCRKANPVMTAGDKVARRAQRATMAEEVRAEFRRLASRNESGPLTYRHICRCNVPTTITKSYAAGQQGLLVRPPEVTSGYFINRGMADLFGTAFLANAFGYLDSSFKSRPNERMRYPFPTEQTFLEIKEAVSSCGDPNGAELLERKIRHDEFVASVCIRLFGCYIPAHFEMGGYEAGENWIAIRAPDPPVIKPAADKKKKKKPQGHLVKRRVLFAVFRSTEGKQGWEKFPSRLTGWQRCVSGNQAVHWTVFQPADFEITSTISRCLKTICTLAYGGDELYYNLARLGASVEKRSIQTATTGFMFGARNSGRIGHYQSDVESTYNEGCNCPAFALLVALGLVVAGSCETSSQVLNFPMSLKLLAGTNKENDYDHNRRLTAVKFWKHLEYSSYNVSTVTAAPGT